ncbi:LacI family DNA-binding transcriptional regulator [Krasilnikoviella flava]|uniref:LacI family DNA-binding transcriptional regulator n=1 Tax=Krasilnikoviella flava TaxID=526729 RepID=UPI0009A583D0
MAQVADRAGVSLGTVSHVLNHPDRVTGGHAGPGPRGDDRARLPAQLGGAHAGGRLERRDRPRPHRPRQLPVRGSGARRDPGGGGRSTTTSPPATYPCRHKAVVLQPTLVVRASTAGDAGA